MPDCREMEQKTQGFFVCSKTKEHRLAKLVIIGPLGKLDLGDQYGSDPFAALHDRQRDSEAPSTF